MPNFAQPSATNATTIDPADFTSHIDNSYFTLVPGTTFVYRDGDSNGADRFTVTYDTKEIMGVTCVVVHDVATVNGLVVEDTYDWFAQDNEGNVWYFGEQSYQLDPGNQVPISTHGSWQAGVDGAMPGIIMEADPKVGDIYGEEHAPGIAEDMAKVLSIDAPVDVIYGSFDEALKTRNFSPLAPGDVEKKYYVPGVGFVLGTDPEGMREQLVSVEVAGRSGDDRLKGYLGDDDMSGRGGDDTIRGGHGSDLLKGHRGNDSLFGNDGGDTLIGGAGDDWLNGGGGADSFHFTGLNNGVVETDTISGYHKGQVDVIDLPGGANSIASDSFVNGVWQLTLAGDGDVIVLDGVADSNFSGHITDELLIV